jgi:hypothetical protein
VTHHVEIAALFGTVAPWVGDDEDLCQLRDRGAVATNNAGDELQDAGDDDVTQPYATCDTEPPEEDSSP